MKAKEIQELINFLSQTGLEEVDIETENFKVRIKRSSEQRVLYSSPIPASQQASSPHAPAPVQEPTATTDNPTSSENKQNAPSQSSSLLEIKSSMIGTFYRSSNPESPPLVEQGSMVKVGDVVCIIEAMKLFNEIESEVSGKIVKVLVENAQPVEYDQPLFLVEPS